MSARRLLASVIVAAALLASCASEAPPELLAQSARFDISVDLPEPETDGAVSLETAISERRSRRDYSAEPLTEAELGQLLWAAQGITDEEGHRAAPSAGALYPLEIHVVTADRIAHYLPHGHMLEARDSGDVRGDVADAAFAQEFVAEAPVILVVSAVPSRTEVKYGALGERYALLEAGHATQNLLLQAEALGLGAVSVGGVDPEIVRNLLALPPGHDPVYVIPVGRR